MEMPVLWVASSDLTDPTPFLARGHALLTTGRQLGPVDEVSDAEAFAYVDRLRRRGVPALGFGVRVVHSAVPQALIEACQFYGMPLFAVPYRVPFIAVIRNAAELIDASGHRRGAWALAAARAISLAALRPQSLEAVLGELYRRLGRPVLLIDALGRVQLARGIDRGEAMDVAQAEAAAILARGRRSSATITVPVPTGPVVLSMQTIGRDGELRAVLVLGGEHRVDSAEQTVVTTAVALAGLALEQGREARRLRGWLRAAVWRSLERGDPVFARRIMRAAGVRVPGEPFRVAVWLGGPTDELIGQLENAYEGGEALAFTVIGDDIVACVPADRCIPLVRSLHTSMQAGVSEPVSLPRLGVATDRARRLAARAEPGEAVVLDEVGAEGGLLTLLVGPDAEDLARANLQPLMDHDLAHGTALVGALAAWLAANGNVEAAARRAGLHRHTLRDRVTRAGHVLGRDLDSADTRADLWLSLRTVGVADADTLEL